MNDALTAVFFLFVGLELERELYNGELSDFKSALLPVFAALGEPIGIALLTFVAVMAGACRLPAGLNWRHIRCG